jgi:multidrug efflux pump subunit AcrB
MWIVRFALQRPYTFVIVAVLVAIFGIASILGTPTDILPDIDIPIVSVIWTYGGLDADDMSKRVVGVCERALPTTVNNIQYTESQSYNGVGVIKIHFQTGVQVDLAIAQVTALSQSLLRLMATGGACRRIDTWSHSRRSADSRSLLEHHIHFGEALLSRHRTPSKIVEL